MFNKYKYKHKYENSVIKVGNNISDYISTEIASNCEFIFSYKYTVIECNTELYQTLQMSVCY